MRILPTDGERLIYLQILAGFDAPAAQNTLAGVVTVKRIAIVDFVCFWFKRITLVLHAEHLRCVVNRAVSVIVVAYSAVEFVIAQNAVERLGPRSGRRLGR